jgi:hypothetical protein
LGDGGGTIVAVLCRSPLPRCPCERCNATCADLRSSSCWW